MDTFCVVYCQVFSLQCPCDPVCQGAVTAAIQSSPVASHMLATAKVGSSGGLTPTQLMQLIMAILALIVPMGG